MPSPAGSTRVLRHHSPLGEWELAVGRPAPRLEEYVTGYEDYVETAAPSAIRRREVPWPGVVLIINYRPAFRLTDPRHAFGPADYGSFVAGLSDSYTIVESTGLSRCVQVNFTPLGAYRFLRLPMDSIANRAVELDDILGGEAQRFVAQLEDAGDPDARFALLDRFFAARIAAARAPSPGVVWAWQQLARSDDPPPIGAIAAELGWSPRWLIARFREQVGLPPKTLARIIRFHRVIRWLDGRDEVRWGELAARAGYYDQAHLNRDFLDLAGSTPGDFLRHRVPNGGVIESD